MKYAIVIVCIALTGCTAVPGAPLPLPPHIDNDAACATGRERGSAAYNWCRWLRGG
jgi:hypothetical protein